MAVVVPYPPVSVAPPPARRGLHPVVIIAVLALGIPFVLMLVTYGTPSPCQALRQELSSVAWLADRPVGLSVAATVKQSLELAAEGVVAKMTPLDCAQSLVSRYLP